MPLRSRANHSSICALLIATKRRLTALFDAPRVLTGSATGSSERSYFRVETPTSICVSARSCSGSSTENCFQLGSSTSARRRCARADASQRHVVRPSPARRPRGLLAAPFFLADAGRGTFSRRDGIAGDSTPSGSPKSRKLGAGASSLVRATRKSFQYAGEFYKSEGVIPR